MTLKFLRVCTAIAALCLVAGATWKLQNLRAGLSLTTAFVDSIPVTVWRNASNTTPSPVVVIAHGFAGSQQLMQPFATTLAQNGYVAVTFDFPGHGHNSQPLTGGLSSMDAMQRDLLDTLNRVSQFALGLEGVDGRLAVLGHSMAADVVVRFASEKPSVMATVAVSLFVPNLARVHPRDLLVIDGSLEPTMMHEQAFAVVGQSIPGAIQSGTTYGDVAAGTGRRIAWARGVEHIGVLYSADSMRESTNWLNLVFGRVSNGFVDSRGIWLGLLLAGIALLAWPLSTLLPRIPLNSAEPTIGWRRTLAVAITPAILTPFILWKLPTDFLPILLGDYLTLHFAVYGALTLFSLWLIRIHRTKRAADQNLFSRFVLAVVFVTAYSLFAIGIPLNQYVFAFIPGAWRLPLIGAVFFGTLPFCIADEWFARRVSGLRGVYTLTKLCFVLSLVIAIALNLEKLFFLVIIVPAILLLFIVYGLLSSLTYRATGNPLVAATANAIVFAWYIGVIFPIVSRAP